jgi:putative transposase
VARAPRAFVAGIYHLGSHGSDDRCLFLSDGEREVFLEGLGQVLERFELGLVSYTLMGNHYHLLLRIPDARVSKALQQLHTWYSRLHNKLNRRSAHLFRAHFFAREIESDDDLLWTARYVAWNPVAAGLAPGPFAWRWSSAAATAGLATPALALELEPLRAAFGGIGAWRRPYRAFIEEVVQVETMIEEGPQIVKSRRPDSNRGPLHYEGKNAYPIGSLAGPSGPPKSCTMPPLRGTTWDRRSRRW